MNRASNIHSSSSSPTIPLNAIPYPAAHGNQDASFTNDHIAATATTTASSANTDQDKTLQKASDTNSSSHKDISLEEQDLLPAIVENGTGTSLEQVGTRATDQMDKEIVIKSNATEKSNRLPMITYQPKFRTMAELEVALADINTKSQGQRAQVFHELEGKDLMQEGQEQKQDSIVETQPALQAWQDQLSLGRGIKNMAELATLIAQLGNARKDMAPENEPDTSLHREGETDEERHRRLVLQLRQLQERAGLLRNTAIEKVAGEELDRLMDDLEAVEKQVLLQDDLLLRDKLLEEKERLLMKSVHEIRVAHSKENAEGQKLVQEEDDEQRTEQSPATKEKQSTTDMKVGIKEFSDVVKKAMEHEKALLAMRIRMAAEERAASNSGGEDADGAESKAEAFPEATNHSTNGNPSSISNNTSNVIVKAETPTGPAATSTTNEAQPHSVNGRQQSPFGVLDIVARRVKDILTRRYTWLESPCPKLFVILPGDFEELHSVGAQSWLDFDLHFVCDCGDLRGSDFHNACPNRAKGADGCDCTPHVDWGFEGYPQQKDLLKFGTYMMAILEMLEYGVTINGVIKVSPLKDMQLRKRVMYSMVFLMKQGIETSHQMLAKGYSSLDEIEPVAPLKEAELVDLYRSRISERRPFRSSYPFRTIDGDIRWLCRAHYAAHTPTQTLVYAPVHSNDHPGLQFVLDMGMGALVATLNTPQQATLFYRAVENMPTVPVISFFLDWDLSFQDTNDLEQAIEKFSASCIKIYVRDQQDEVDHPVGLYHRSTVALSYGLLNENVQAFTIERRVPGDGANESVDELFASKGIVYLDPVLVRFTRELTNPKKIQLGLLVMDLDKAARSLRSLMGGYGRLSKLTLEASYWDHIDIDFGIDNLETDLNLNGDPQLSDLSGSMDDTAGDGTIEFFNKRKCDAITVRTYLSADTMFLRTHVLKDINIRISFPEDGPRIRELIKNNHRLTKMELSIDSKDDPCQVFEYFKALMNNHPSLDSFHLRKDWGKNNKSTFVWHGVSDRSKMTLSIMSYAEDKIGTLLQKFGACLLQLFIHSINIQDSIILEKVTRTRKGQLKLVTISLVDVFSVSLTALDELAKVVLRVPLQRFQITGTVNPRTTSRVGEFMTTVAAKITDINFYGEHTKAILTDLTKRMPESSNMELLDELKLSGPFDATTKDLTWIRSVLQKPMPIHTIDLHKVNLSHQGWMTLAQEIDFQRLKYFRVGPDVPLKIEAVKAFVNAVPAKSELENFHLDSGGLKELHCRAYKAKVLAHLKKRTALVSIGRYF
ncbi:hypothetical protein BGZ54_005583 [Gamsiella multidivaricata]|nr:hypothetical protein BGZ54_005583 [Gamsiella multidivaricata]